MSKEKLSIGFSFGLFAVFSILRYRTEAVPIKEMTYMFVSISMAVLNALSSGFISIGSLIASDLSIVLVIFLLERIWTRYEQFKFINYEKIELIKPPRREELITDLSARTGLNISRIEVEEINFLNDTANIKIFYYD
jgi:hypothetical protein